MHTLRGALQALYGGHSTSCQCILTALLCQDDGPKPQPASSSSKPHDEHKSHRLPGDAQPHMMVLAFGHNCAGTLAPVTDAIRTHHASIMKVLCTPSPS